MKKVNESLGNNHIKALEYLTRTIELKKKYMNFAENEARSTVAITYRITK